jgi:hypothetical protein
MRRSTRCSDQAVDDPTALPIQTMFARATSGPDPVPCVRASRRRLLAR